MSNLKLPPTRNHRQLAIWINEHKLVDNRGRLVCARVNRVRTSTDRKVGRLRRPGKGRQGLLLEIWLLEPPSSLPTPQPTKSHYEARRLYRHESSETYRRHSEAREWVEQHLRQSSKRQGKSAALRR